MKEYLFILSFIYLTQKIKVKKIFQKASIITDDDRYAKAKNSFKNLTAKTFAKLDNYHKGLYSAKVNNRISNLKSTIVSSKIRLSCLQLLKHWNMKLPTQT